MNELQGLFAVNVAAWGFVDWAKAIVLVLAIVAIVYIATKAMGVPVPQWLVQICVVVLVAVVAIVAISILAGL